MMKSREARRAGHWVRLFAGLLLLAMVIYGWWERQQHREQVPQAPERPNAAVLEKSPSQDIAAETPAERSSEKELPGRSAEETSTEVAAARVVIPAQTIYDREGEIAFEGDVDVTATLARIEAGERLRFPNDGATFQNRERRLPRQPAGYYKEYVHPTPGLPGPGPQRIVIGKQGETYYTADHYESFRRLDKP